MWNCPCCAKKVDDVFDACWNCGASRDGVLDPDFVGEVDVAGKADTGKDAIFFVRRTLKGVAHAITAPPRQSIPRWASWCCTAIVVAHRLGTVQRADDILILEQGHPVEQGERARLATDPASRFYQLLQTGLEEVLV